MKLQPAFPAPDHDHGRCAADAIHHAENVCEKRGQRLTPIRRHVLEALLASHQPLGAYEIISTLGRDGDAPAPITVYRALEFLIANGFAHRIESRNAFLACVHDHDDTGLVAFLICEQCGAAGEVEASGLARTLKDVGRHAGFAPRMSVVEISGICRNCAQNGKPAKEAEA
jgi:Fur family transcriptional regulator, zinc uptake regulator